MEKEIESLGRLCDDLQAIDDKANANRRTDPIALSNSTDAPLRRNSFK
jgi:hypothetical protein